MSPKVHKQWQSPWSILTLSVPGLRRRVSDEPGLPETSTTLLMRARAVLKEFGADSDIARLIQLVCLGMRKWKI